LDDDAWGVVKNTPGVTGFVGAGNTPVPLSQPEVDRILRTGTAIGERQRAQVEFTLGESVKVTSGPLSDFDGEIVDVNGDAQKLKVLVDIFERQVPVELGFDQVKKLDWLGQESSDTHQAADPRRPDQHRVHERSSA